jgi:hypothetical protein
MSQLKTILAISIALLGATAGSAQAAGSHKHISLFDLFQDAEEQLQFLMSGVRIPNDIFGDPSKVPEKPSGNDGTWQTSTDSRDETVTTNTENQPDKTWTPEEVSQPPQSPWTPHYATP